MLNIFNRKPVSQIVKAGQLITTPGPDMNEMWYRDFQISENNGTTGLFYIFQGDAFKKYVKLQKVVSNAEQPQSERQTRYIFRTADMGEGRLYHLMYIKTKTQTTPHFHLCGISFKNNTADFIHFRITTKVGVQVVTAILEYIHMPDILKQTHIAVPNETQYEFIGEPTQEWKPIFSETRLKDAIGLFLKFLILIFKVDHDSISLLKSGAPTDKTYNFVITDIDRDIGQNINHVVGALEQKTIGIFSDDNPTDPNTYITKYIKELHELKMNNITLLEKYGGKRKTIRKKLKKRRTQKSKNRRRQKKR